MSASSPRPRSGCSCPWSASCSRCGRTATRPRPRCRWRSIRPSATAGSSAAICCCSKRSAAASPGARASFATETPGVARWRHLPTSAHFRVAVRPYNGFMSNLFRAAASLLWLGASSAFAAEYPVPAHDEMFGEVQVVKARYEDTFVAFAQKYNVGYEALKRANPGVDPWLPGEGTRIVVPTQFVLPRAPHRGIVVNVAELRLYYFPADTADAWDAADESRRIVTYPISIGQMDWSTPLGTTRVTGKVTNPSWY